LYTSCVLWVAPLCAFFNIFYLSKKGNKKTSKLKR
jgi:hypothetical protein